ncbi:MAG: hypothetical protein ACODAU_07315 [Myxococcota bacterium]
MVAAPPRMPSPSSEPPSPRLPGPAWLVPALAAAGVVAAALWLALDRTTSPVPEWLATSLLAVSVYTLWVHPWGRKAEQAVAAVRSAVPGRARRAVPLLLVTVIAAAAFWPLPAGGVPIGQDHAQHYFSTHVLVNDLLPQGRLFGWTERFSVGRPFGDTYATGAYLVTGLAHLVTFGWVSLEASYGFGIFLAWLVGALGIAAWAARLAGGGPEAGERPSIAWLAAVVGGALWVLDTGGDRQGGWIYAMYHGVWPQVLSTGLWAVALLLFVRFVERQTVGRLGAAVLLSVAAVCTHPAGVPNLLVALPLLLVVVAVARGWQADREEPEGPSAEPRRALPWLVVASVLAGVAAMGWFAHMLHASDEEYMLQLVTLWGTLRERVLGMLEGEPFDHQWAVGAVAALVGIAAVLRRGGWVRVFAVTILVAFLVIGTAELVTAFDLGVHPDYRSLMYNRFSISMKPFWYALAGVGVAAMVQGVRRLAAGAEPVPWMLGALVWLVLGPVLWSAWQAAPSLVHTPATRPLTIESARLGGVLASMERLLVREARRIGDARPVRAVLWEEGEQGAYELLPLANAGFGFVPVRATPTQTYRYLVTASDPEVLRFLGASVLVSDKEVPFDGAQLLGRFGRHHVYRIQEDPRWPVKLEGAGRVRVKRWEPHRRVLALSGTTAESRLVLGMPPYDKWKARQGDRERLLDDHHGMRGVRLTSLGALEDGELVLTYEDTPRERLFEILAAVILSLCLLSLIAWRLPVPRLVRGRRWLRAATATTLVLALVAVGWAAAEANAMRDEGLRARWLHDDPPELRVVAVLHQRAPDRVGFSPEARCVQPYTRAYSTRCDERELWPRLHPSQPEHNPKERNVPLHPPRPRIALPACLRVGVPGEGTSGVEWSLPPGTDHLEGRLVSLDRRPASGMLRAGDARARVATNGQRFRLEPPPGAEKVTLRLNSPRHTTFACLELVAVGR